MTYRELCGYLTDAGIENANVEGALLLGHFFGVSPASLMADPERSYDSDNLLRAVEKRCERYPLQYIFGEWDFYKESYFVNESCLIPRSDTELLVEYAIAHLPKEAHFADLCTGSGCIAVSTLVHRADCTALAVDLYDNTLSMAKKNAMRHGLCNRLTFLCADVLEDSLPQNESFDAILCNPPYIRTAVLDTLEEELFFEPRAALDGGFDGLEFYRALLSHHIKHLKKNGFLLFEIGFDQKDDLIALSAEHGCCCKIHHDLSGNPRMAVIREVSRKEITK